MTIQNKNGILITTNPIFLVGIKRGDFMKISTRGRYGLRAMVNIAVFGCRNNISLRSIAERENIPESYLEQLFIPLRKAGLVKSIRGAQGGYCLGDDADNIKVGDIFRVLEDSFNSIGCPEDKLCEAEECKKCVSKKVLERINDSINETVDSITLGELARQYIQENKELFE